MKPGNSGGGKGPHFWDAFEGTKVEEIGVSLKTPEKIRQFQRKLYVKAKEETASQGALARHPAIHRYVYFRRAWSPTTPAVAYSRPVLPVGAPTIANT